MASQAVGGKWSEAEFSGSNVFVLAHLSDPHLAPLPRPRIAELASKRLSGYLNWLRKRRAIHRSDLLAAIMRDVVGARADHIAVTGDLVNIALPAEFENARRWLEALGPPADVSLVPGNHDAYVTGADALRDRLWAPYMSGDAATGTADPCDEERPRGATSPSPRLRGEGRGEGAFPQVQTRGEGPSPGVQERVDLSPRAGRGTHIRADTYDPNSWHRDDTVFPYLRIRGPVALIGVSTAVPTPPFMATGRLGGSQIASMTALLGEARAQFRVVLIHHPPHEVPQSHLKRLVDAAAFREAVAAAGAELVIHGHDHVRSLAWIDGPRRRVPVIGVPSASTAFGTDYDAAGYNIYRIAGHPGDWTCEVIRRGLGADGAVSEWERFAV
jgi:3',5'-cyclic AMP phosphodiesterase CpdA